MNNRPGFILYKSYYESIKDLTLEEKGQLLDALFQYQITEVTPVIPVIPVKIAFNFIVNQFQLDDKKYDDFVIRQSDKGKKSALKRWGSKVTPVIPVKKKVTEVTYKDKEKEKDIPLVASPNYLNAIPYEDLKEFTKISRATEIQIRTKGNMLFDYCQSKGKKYKDYKALLRNALRKDYPLQNDQDSDYNSMGELQFIKKLGYKEMN